MKDHPTTPAAQPAGTPVAAAAAAVARDTPHVLVIGAGFGGIEVARALGKAGQRVTVIDRQNHHLFQPLLYQVATAALSAADIAEPIRKMLRRFPTVEVMMAEVARIDTAARLVHLTDGTTVAYDILVLATGSRPGYFGKDHWAKAAKGLKSTTDALHVRSQLLLAFERAERAADPAEKERLMTTVVIGGGPTGVEMAGSVAELARHTLVRDFRHIRPEAARVLLIEAGPRILSGFDPGLADDAAMRLARLGVEIRTAAPVQDITEGRVTLAHEDIAAGLIIWAAGVEASPLAAALGGDTDRTGRVRVDPTLAVKGVAGVYAIGDAALFIADGGADGTARTPAPLPGLAQVARQQGQHLGRALARLITTGKAVPPFVYRSRGNTAIVGRNAAIFEAGRLRLRGFPAWLLWAVVHVFLLVGFQQRVLVTVQWLWRYLTYERGARLIAPDAPRHLPPDADAPSPISPPTGP